MCANDGVFIDELLKNEDPEPEEKKNYAGEGRFYYDI